MGWIEFAATVITAAAWPAALVAVVFVLRAGIGAILARIADQEVASIEVFGQKLTFARALARVAERAREAQRTATAEMDNAPSPSEDDTARGEDSTGAEGVGEPAQPAASWSRAKGPGAAGDALSTDHLARWQWAEFSAHEGGDLPSKNQDPGVLVLSSWDRLMVTSDIALRMGFGDRFPVGPGGTHPLLSRREDEALQGLFELRQAVLESRARPTPAEAYAYVQSTDVLGRTMLRRASRMAASREAPREGGAPREGAGAEGRASGLGDQVVP